MRRHVFSLCGSYNFPSHRFALSSSFLIFRSWKCPHNPVGDTDLICKFCCVWKKLRTSIQMAFTLNFRQSDKQLHKYKEPGQYTLNALHVGKNISRRYFEVFFIIYFLQKIGFDIACKLSPFEDDLRDISKPIF